MSEPAIQLIIEKSLGYGHPDTQPTRPQKSCCIFNSNLLETFFFEIKKKHHFF